MGGRRAVVLRLIKKWLDIWSSIRGVDIIFEEPAHLLITVLTAWMTASQMRNAKVSKQGSMMLTMCNILLNFFAA